MDPLLFVKTKMMTYIYDLLKAKPEEEQNLLTLLVNKMGDQERKIASKTTHLLSQLLQEHPAMKVIVIKEVERLLFRANVAEKAKYYAIIFLNQIVLSNRPDDKAAANYMIQLYFSVFEGLVPQIKSTERGKKSKKPAKNEVSAAQADGINVKVMGGLLTGVNRAFPYSNIDDDVYVYQPRLILLQIRKAHRDVVHNLPFGDLSHFYSSTFFDISSAIDSPGMYYH